MKVLTWRRSKPEDLSGIRGTVRLDRRTKNLAKRVRPGEIAVIDHVDLDGAMAQKLVECGVGAVVNAQPSSSGRYPNLGPQKLVDAGIPLLDGVGPDIFTKVRDGRTVRLDASVLYMGEREIASGTRQTSDSVSAAVEEARSGLAAHVEAFADTTVRYLERERELLLDGVGLPPTRTDLEGRHVLVVVRGRRHHAEIAELREYIKECRPAFIAVDDGADALLEVGYTPDMIVGDMETVSDAALTCGAELVVRAYREGHAPGLRRVKELGREAAVFPATGTNEDLALLLADDKGAALIIAAGTHNTLEEFLDKGRAGMASSFLTRLRVGSKLVDARAVSRVYRRRTSRVTLALLLAVALLTLLAAVYVTPAGRSFFLSYVPALGDLVVSWVTGFFT